MKKENQNIKGDYKKSTKEKQPVKEADANFGQYLPIRTALKLSK